MDFSLSEEQGDLRALAREILEDKVTDVRLREVEAAEDRFDPETWRVLGEANLLGIGLPEEVGGSGYGFIEQCLVLEEVGRTVAPVPVWASCVLGALPVATFGTAEQKATWATPAATGQRILTAALTEPDNPHSIPLRTRAERTDAGWTVTGVKTRVPAGPLASAVLVPAVVESGPAIGVFIVDTAAPGVTMQRQRTTDKDSEGHLELDGVTVRDDQLLGSVDDGGEILDWLLERATVGLCAMQLGVCSRALEMTAQYATTRVAFGRPIATFQAVGQRAADAYIDVEGIRLSLWQAAWRLSEGLPARTEVETAKFWAADAGHRVGHAAVHLHGGVGIDYDYPLHRYFLATKQNELTLGGATDQLLRIGDELATSAASTSADRGGDIAR
ncbi:acyl-CoA dehydrogenase family protein [Pseudonocardia nigra]|uniref:acyl-CoA dehydrogenase family protein n=1 Tax=Pseudonocardia nigra TaxID=1921578 RepID=UPI001C5CCDEF|nr:acyl-CoA dehydrogenase family protein [Pseudonocardia nigra]